MPLPNVGADKAATAAAAVGGTVLVPNFSPADFDTDWNDYAVQHGRAAVRAAVETTLRAHGIE